MEKYLVSIEFRYTVKPKYKDDSTHRNKIVTIGFYDDFNEACKSGNDILINLESRFNLHCFPDGRKATNQRFSENGGCFGSKNTLVTNLAYLKTPFEFYAKITTLQYNNIDEIINNIIESVKK